jgi:hypothetical protein
MISYLRFHSLLQHQQKLQDARFAGRVGTEKTSDGTKLNGAGILPGLEVLDAQGVKHSGRSEVGEGTGTAATRATTYYISGEKAYSLKKLWITHPELFRRG